MKRKYKFSKDNWSEHDVSTDFSAKSAYCNMD